MSKYSLDLIRGLAFQLAEVYEADYVELFGDMADLHFTEPGIILIHKREIATEIINFLSRNSADVQKTELAVAFRISAAKTLKENGYLFLNDVVENYVGEAVNIDSITILFLPPNWRVDSENLRKPFDKLFGRGLWDNMLRTVHPIKNTTCVD